MRCLLKVSAVGSLVLLLSGCGNLRPQFFHPGRIEQQRVNATYHDPYADNNAGPEVVGGRPRDYLEPRPEAVRDQPYYNGLWAPHR